MVLRRGFAIALLVASGCASSPGIQPKTKVQRAHARQAAVVDQVVIDAPEKPVRQPLEINAVAEREGSLLRVDVDAVGRAHRQGEGFETPASWKVDVALAGQPLKCLMRGPVRVAREPVGDFKHDAWDVEVSFSAFFQLPADAPPTKVQVVVVAPENAGEHRFEQRLVPAVAAR